MRSGIVSNFGIVLPAIFVFAGCAADQAEVQAPVPQVAEEPGAVEAPVQLVAEPNLTATPNLEPRERLQLAIQQLEVGDADQAAVELHQYVSEVPNAEQANYLLEQIETPIETLYPVENFTVELNPGETLSSLAGTYLGNVLGFYGLARYNDVENPSLVTEGQTIRIPSTEASLAAHEERLNPSAAPGAAVAQAPPSAPVPVNQWISTRTHVAAGRFAEAISEAEDNRIMPNANEAVVLASAYDGHAREIQATNTQQAAAHALRAGQLRLQTADLPEEALSSLELATQLAPGNAEAQSLLASAKTQTVELYYRRGVEAFQRQDLDGAITAYDRVLEIDPDHQNAQVNRVQAVELRQNLQRFQ